MSETVPFPAVSPVSAGLGGRCPRCGKGPLFSGFLDTAPSCTACGLDYGFIDAGDGPAVFVILIAGFVIVALALYVEVTWQPALWIHALLWLPLTLVLCIGGLRPLKGLMVALQYRNRAAESRHGGSGEAGA
ncbi:DUF983 domain-containing protein [Chthonobacter rhizosphaerae]|uniref:DUF983 domain-containing protein n=1 Tax=Chthonobacter rhizosphaerae TaxID=2735553 RepID=UPI0015EE41E3|nr:DUF983 domain-containing protein [Chthonobacter rhizosphaerae]